MKLLVTGVSHKTAPVEVRERLAFSEAALPVALQELLSREGIAEAVVLSTCNRVEIAVSTDDAAFRRRRSGHASIITKAGRRFTICSAWPPAWTPW
jgi:glutamyl-tRNA reductase